MPDARAAAAARRGGGATNPAVSGTTPTHSSGRRRWSSAAATQSSSTASRAQQPRHRNGIGVVMRRSEALGLRGAHACRRRDYAEEVTSRPVAEEPTMMATRESEIGSPGHDGLVRRARGVQGGESRAPAAPWRVSGPRDIIHRCTANSRLAGGCVAANFWRPQLSRWPFRWTSENGSHCCRVL